MDQEAKQIFGMQTEETLRKDPNRALGDLMWAPEDHSLSDAEVSTYLTGIGVKIGVCLGVPPWKIGSLNQAIGGQPANLFLAGKYLQDGESLTPLLRETDEGKFGRVVTRRFGQRLREPDISVLTVYGPILEKGIRPGLLVELLKETASINFDQAKQILSGCGPAMRRFPDGRYLLHPQVALIMRDHFLPTLNIKRLKRKILLEAAGWYEESLEAKGPIGTIGSGPDLQLQKEWVWCLFSLGKGFEEYLKLFDSAFRPRKTDAEPYSPGWRRDSAQLLWKMVRDEFGGTLSPLQRGELALQQCKLCLAQGLVSDALDQARTLLREHQKTSLEHKIKRFLQLASMFRPNSGD